MSNIFRIVLVILVAAAVALATFFLGYLSFQNDSLETENSIIAHYSNCIQVRNNGIKTIMTVAQLNNQYQESFRGYLETIFSSVDSQSANTATENLLAVMALNATMTGTDQTKTTVEVMDTVREKLKDMDGCLITLADRQQAYATMIGYTLLGEGYINNKPFPASVYSEWAGVPRRFAPNQLPGVTSKQDNPYVTVFDIVPRLVMPEVLEAFQTGVDTPLILPTPLP